jgi:hypothetical protein
VQKRPKVYSNSHLSPLGIVHRKGTSLLNVEITISRREIGKVSLLGEPDCDFVLGHCLLCTKQPHQFHNSFTTPERKPIIMKKTDLLGLAKPIGPTRRYDS